MSKFDSFKSGPASNFVELTIQLLSCPASSAAIERVFSSFGLIHSKLVMCYRMLHSINEDMDY